MTTTREQKRAYRHRAAQRMRAWRRLPCERCHTTKVARGFAHLAPTRLKGRGRGQMRRYQDIRRHPEAYALLCGTCHLHLDLGVVTWVRVGRAVVVG